MEPKVYLIPSSNLSHFKEKFAKLQRKASRIGVEIPSYSIIKEELVTQFKQNAENPLGQPEKFTVLLHSVVIHTGKVIVNGFEFIASIEHTEEGNLIRSHSEETVPTVYRTAKSNCDHCNMNRRRNDTFVLQNTNDSSFMQVGRNCLADFLGRDGEDFARRAEFTFDANELAEASEGGGEGGPRYDHLDLYLSYVAEAIATCGWVSKGMSQKNGNQSTAYLALDVMYPPRDMNKNELPFRTPTDKSVSVAKDAITWAENLSDSEVEGSDYLNNIRVIARRGIVDARQYGFAASIVSSYQRMLGELVAKQRNANKPSEYVGAVGDKLTVEVTVDKVVTCEGMYGTTYLHMFTDGNGNRLTWFASSGALETGKTVKIKGTIKKLEEYKGTKQTIMTRCRCVSA